MLKQLNVRSITCLKIGRSSPGANRASVKNRVINVAMSGSIIPTPLATPTTVGALGPSPTRAEATLATVSVVIMARATRKASVSENGYRTEAIWERIFSMGYGRPITPVEAITTS